MPFSDNQIYSTFGSKSSTGKIDPFVSRLVRNNGGRQVISYGLSSAGYDLRLSDRGYILIKPPHHTEPMDVKSDTLTMYYAACRADCGYNQDETDPICRFTIPGKSVLISSSVETIFMPDDVFALAVGKSTYARAGIHVLVTPLEPGWRGTLTIEIANLNNFPVFVYAHEGICQLVFFPLDERPDVTYNDRNGKYQGQTDPTLPKV